MARPTWVPRTLALRVTRTCGHVLRARRRLVVPAFVSCLCAHACIFDLGVHMLKVLRCVMVLCWCFVCACGLVLCGGLVVLSFAYGCYCFCVCLCLAMRVRVCCCCELGACVYCELVFLIRRGPKGNTTQQHKGQQQHTTRAQRNELLLLLLLLLLVLLVLLLLLLLLLLRLLPPR